MKDLVWNIKSFTEISTKEFHNIVKARIDVFVVEQNCPYPDLDGYDEKALHLWAEQDGEVTAYCRIFAPGIKYPEASIGRVMTNQKFRRRKLGKILMRFALNTIEAQFRTTAIRISAQDYLLPFYSGLGFEATDKKYLEDDIPHTEMFRK
ncbi:MAG: GNAT family N-acetyltransferase [Kaistella sp.]|nr:GNAT family N-acetyltransferase [Kaistella sp.]